MPKKSQKTIEVITPKRPSVEDAQALVFKYRETDPLVVEVAKAYCIMLTLRELAGEKWDRLDELVASLKRAFKD